MEESDECAILWKQLKEINTKDPARQHMPKMIYDTEFLVLKNLVIVKEKYWSNRN